MKAKKPKLPRQKHKVSNEQVVVRAVQRQEIDMTRLAEVLVSILEEEELQKNAKDKPSKAA